MMTNDPDRTAADPALSPGAGSDDEVDVERQLGALIDDVHRLLTRTFDRRMAKLELTRAQWRVLTFLIRQDGMTQSALADLLEMERAPLGRLLDRLEESGWVRRDADPGDKRAKRVYRTSKVDPFLDRLKDDAHDVISMALGGVDGAERRRMIAGLSRIKANLQQNEAASASQDDAAFETPAAARGRFSDL